MNQMKLRILIFLKKSRNKLGCAQSIPVLLTAIIAALLFRGAVEVLALFVPVYYPKVISMIGMTVCILVAVVLILKRWPSMKKTALYCDRQGYHEEFITVLEEMDGKENAYFELLLTSLTKKMQSIPVTFPWKKKEILCKTVLCIVLFVAGSLVSFIPSKSKTMAKEYQTLQKEKHNIEIALKKEEKNRQLSESLKEEQKLWIHKAYKEAIKSVKSSKDRQEMEESLARLEKKLEQTNLNGSKLAKEKQNLLAKASNRSGNLGESEGQTTKSPGQKNENGDSGNSNNSQQENKSNSSKNERSGETNNQNTNSNANADGNSSSQNQNQGNENQNGNKQNTGTGQEAGNGENENPNNGNGKGNGSGKGKGWNYGSKTGKQSDYEKGDRITVNKDFYDTDGLAGTKSESGQKKMGKARSDSSFKGEKKKYSDVYADYKADAFSRMESGNYSSGTKIKIKKYFESLGE